jgi:hypothetical protein
MYGRVPLDFANVKEAIHDGNKLYYNDWRF